MAVKILLTTKQIEIIKKKKFVIAALDTNGETFIVHIMVLAEPIIITIYPICETYITLLTSIKILTKYFNFLDIFSFNFTAKLLEHTRINNHLINLLYNKKPLYSLI